MDFRNQFLNNLSTGGFTMGGRKNQLAEVERQKQAEQLALRNAQQRLISGQLANQAAQKQLSSPQVKFGEIFKGADGNHYQQKFDESGRLVGSVKAGMESNPSTMMASSGGDSGMPQSSVMFPEQAEEKLTGLALEASLYLPDGISWGDATNEQRREAHKAVTSSKREPVDPTGLRKEYKSVTDDFSKVDAAFGRITKSAENPSAAGDLALIFNYMKMLDPGSVVRESEFRTAEQAKGWLGKMDNGGVAVPNQVRTAIQKAADGTLLLPEQRADFVGRAQGLYGDALSSYDNTVSEFSRIAEGMNVRPDLAIFNRANHRDFSLPSSPNAAPELPDLTGLDPEAQSEFMELWEWKHGKR